MAIALSKKLTPRQQRFVAEFVVHRNGARAARAAGYSANSAKVTASRLLTVDNVRRAISTEEIAIAAAIAMSKHTVTANVLNAIAVAKRKDDPRAIIAGWTTVAKMCGFIGQTRRAR